jgi:putative spermidine/putrescine transport system permease protein
MGHAMAVATATRAPASRSRFTFDRARVLRWLLFAGVFAYLVLPMIAVVLYSFATRWTANVLPDGYTLDWWRNVFSDSAAVSAFQTTMILAVIVAVLDIAIVVPAVYWARVRTPAIRNLVEPAAAIPFALPYLVIGFSLLQFAGIVAPGLQGTFPLLVAGHVAIAFPFVYWAVDGSMAAAGIERLSEAAETCGASPTQIIRRVVLPNVQPGIVSGALLAFATSFGEFAMVQTIARGVYTVPIWSAEQIRSYTGDSGAFNRLAAVTTLSFVVLFAISAFVVYRNRGRSVSLLATTDRTKREG